MIAIVDYGSGNLKSIKNALDNIKVDSRITSSPEFIEKSDKIVFPGVGSFGYMMKTLKDKGLVEPIMSAIESGKPFLGICLGMQVLFDYSDEDPGVKGLGIFRGKVVRFTKGKIPQIGWNRIIPVKKEFFCGGYAYFVNSYCVVPEDKSITVAVTDYSGNFVSVISKDNVTAVQFHPEKSGTFGMDFLKRWSEC